VDVPRRLILAQLAREGPCNDFASLRPLVDMGRTVTSIGLGLADAEFDSEQNHQHLHQQVGAQSVIPAKQRKAGWNVSGIPAEMRRELPEELYGQPWLAKSVLSAVKRKLSPRATSRLQVMKQKQALLLAIAYNCDRRHVRLPLWLAAAQVYRLQKHCGD
jgi:hypothetical protein